MNAGTVDSDHSKFRQGPGKTLGASRNTHDLNLPIKTDSNRTIELRNDSVFFMDMTYRLACYASAPVSSYLIITHVPVASEHLKAGPFSH